MEQLGHIYRKSMLYRTKVEYGDWAMNHVQGCSHGCNFPCYAYLMAKRFGRVKTYEEWRRPSLVDNTLDLLRKELPRYCDEIKQVQLCFTTDPFMLGYPEVGSMSLGAIELINEYGKPCSILTKGELPVELAALPNAALNTYGIPWCHLMRTIGKGWNPVQRHTQSGLPLSSLSIRLAVRLGLAWSHIRLQISVSKIWMRCCAKSLLSIKLFW